MKDCSIKSKNSLNDGAISINRSLKSILGVDSEYSSSNESLLTLLNASIEHQQARFNSLSQGTMNTLKSKHSTKQINEDEEMEIFTDQNLEIKSEIEQEDSLKKKKKRKHKDRDGKNSNENELEIPTIILPKKHKKKKHDHSGVLEVENDIVVNENIIQKTKKKKHRKESNFTEIENIARLKSCSPELNEPILNESIILPKKTKKRKHKHSSISEIEDNYEENENELSKEVKRKKNKHNRSCISEVEDNGKESKKHKGHKKSESISSIEEIKQEKLKHSSISEVENNGKENKKHKGRKKSESVSSIEEIKQGKPKHSSISEVEDNREESKKHKRHKKFESVSSVEEVKQKKPKYSSISEVEDNGEEKKRHKRHEKTNSVSSVEDNGEENKNRKDHKKSESLSSVVEDNGKENKNHKGHQKSESGSLIQEIKKEKPKHSSTSEIEDNGKGKQKHKGRKKSESISSVEEMQKEKQEDDSLSKTYEENKYGDSETLKSAASENIKSDKVKNNKKYIKPTPKKRSINQLDTIKSNHKKYYLTPTIKSAHNEDNDEQNENKIKAMNFINEALDTALEKKQLNDDDMCVLNDLHIVVPWELPESHTIETRLSHPTSEQYKEFKELDFAMKSGPYNKDEDQKIKDNWENFCRDHDLKISPLAFFPVEGENRSLLPTDQRINFVRYLGKDLKHRTLCSIYNRFQLLFRPFKKGKFTTEEDSIILTFVENSNVSNKYSALSPILNRGRELIKKRHQVLISDDEKLSWNMSLLQDLVNNLLEVTGKINVDDLKEFSIEAAHWKAIEKKMNIPAPKIRRKWVLYIYPRLFVEEYCTLNEIREKLIEDLYHTKEDDRKKINWNKLAENFNGITGARLYKIFLDMLALYVSDADKTNFRDIIIRLKGMLPQMLLLKNKSLSKFVHRDGQLFDTKYL